MKNSILENVFVIFIFLLLIWINCKNNKKSPSPLPRPLSPIKYYSKLCPFKNITILQGDSLRIISTPYTTADRNITKNADHILSIVEVYDINNNRLFNSIKTAFDTTAIVQDIKIFPLSADTIRVRAWGLSYDIKDTLDYFESYKMDIKSTVLFEMVLFPGGRITDPEKIKHLIKRSE